MKQTETAQAASTSNTHQEESKGTAAPVRKRSRRRRLPSW